MKDFKLLDIVYFEGGWVRKGVIKSIINSIDGVRYEVMSFDEDGDETVSVVKEVFKTFEEAVWDMKDETEQQTKWLEDWINKQKRL